MVTSMKRRLRRAAVVVMERVIANPQLTRAALGILNRVPALKWWLRRMRMSTIRPMRPVSDLRLDPDSEAVYRRLVDNIQRQRTTDPR